jgi:hypothetical protein
VASTTSPPPRQFRLLLDQGFPNPPGFRPESVDRNLSVKHLSHWRPDLSARRTPDWVVYCEAALAGFNALVTRDFSQVEQAEEMLALDRLRDFHIVSWRQRMDDPVSEWGQLLAYLPQLRRFLGEHQSRVIFLPVPSLTTNNNVHAPKRYLGQIATATGTSVAQVRRTALRQIEEWERDVALQPGLYSTRLTRRR